MDDHGVERTITATMLAQEKMTEVMLQLESDGFKDQDIGGTSRTMSLRAWI